MKLATPAAQLAMQSMTGGTPREEAPTSAVASHMSRRSAARHVPSIIRSSLDCESVAADHEDMVDGPALAGRARRDNLEWAEASVPEGAQTPGVDVVDPDSEDRVSAQRHQPEPREQANDACADASAPQVWDTDQEIDALQRPAREAPLEALDVHVLQPASADIAPGQLDDEDVGGLRNVVVHVAEVLEREQRGGVILHEVMDLGVVVPLQGPRQIVFAHGLQHQVPVHEPDIVAGQCVRVPR